MKLSKWKNLLEAEIYNINRWDDAEIMLAYYLIEAKNRQMRRKGNNKEELEWWGGLNPTKKMKHIKRLFNEEN